MVANLQTGIVDYTQSGLSRDRLSSIENIRTGHGDDTITGSAGNNVIECGGGYNTVFGGAGNDRIVGGVTLGVGERTGRRSWSGSTAGRATT